MIGIFITARLGSSRLYQKHLIEVNNKPFINYLIDRFYNYYKADIINSKIKIFITTSNNEENKKFESILDLNKTKIFYGSDSNIPLRHWECATKHKIDHIISIDGDDILCSVEASKLVINSLLNGSKITHTKGLPLGMNCTGYSRDFLEKSINGYRNEILETGWGKIFDEKKIHHINIDVSKNIRNIRMTLDYPDDVKFFKKVIENTQLLSLSDEELIDTIIEYNWHLINIHLNDIYWSNFNKEKNEE